MPDLPVTNMAALIAKYEVLLLDAYGVLIHHQGAFPGAVELIAQLNRSGKPYFVVTNDGVRLIPTLSRVYRTMGLDIDEGHIITPGSLLPQYFIRHGLQNMPCVVLGPKETQQYVVQAGGVVIEPKAEAQAQLVVVGNEGGFPFLETMDALLTMLFRKLDQGETMRLILLDADIIYQKTATAYGFNTGIVSLLIESAIRLRYPGSDLGFVCLGKPFSPMFEEAQRRCNTRNMVMIGDQLKTDILGAHNFGIDSALIATGLTKWTQALQNATVRPTYLLETLAL